MERIGLDPRHREINPARFGINAGRIDLNLGEKEIAAGRIGINPSKVGVKENENDPTQAGARVAWMRFQFKSTSLPKSNSILIYFMARKTVVSVRSGTSGPCFVPTLTWESCTSSPGGIRRLCRGASVGALLRSGPGFGREVFDLPVGHRRQPGEHFAQVGER